MTNNPFIAPEQRSGPEIPPRINRRRLGLAGLAAAVVTCPLALVSYSAAATSVLKCDTGPNSVSVTYVVANEGLRTGSFDVTIRLYNVDYYSYGEAREHVSDLPGGASVTRNVVIRYREDGEPEDGSGPSICEVRAD